MSSGTINEQPPMFRPQEQPLGKVQQEEVQVGGKEYDKGFIDVHLKPSEQLQPGIHRPSGGTTAGTTSLPNLVTPDWSLVTTAGLGLTLATDILAVIDSTFQETITSLSSGIAEEDELSYIREAMAEAMSEEAPGVGTSPPSAESPPVSSPKTAPMTGSNLSQLWNNIENSVKAGTVTIPEGHQQIVENMSSQDPLKVREAFSQIINLDTYNLTADQKILVENTLNDLANNIAGTIAEGGSASFFIRLGLPELLALQFSTAVELSSNTTISEADKDLLKQIFIDAGTNLSAINFTYATSLKPPSKEYTQLTSQNATQLSTLMTNLLNTIAIPEGTMTEEERSVFIAALVEELSGKPLSTKLSSCSQEEVTEYLTKIINQLAKNGKIPGDTASITTLTMYILPGLSQKIATINKGKHLNDLYSPDSSVIDSALHKLGNLTPMPDLEGIESLPPEEIAKQYGATAVLESYLKVLVKVLSFLAQIRCLISNLEGKFSQELAKAKMSALADQVQASLHTLKEELAKIETQFANQLGQIKHAAKMKWVMPLISGIVSITALVISIVITIVTLGLAGPAAVTAGTWVIAATVILASTLACGISIVDAILSATGHKTIFDMFAEEIISWFGQLNPPPWLKAVVNCILQAITMITLIILTMGAGLAIAAIKSAQKLAETMTQILLAFGKVFVFIVFPSVIQPILSSGLLLQGILQFLKLCMPKQDEITQTIIAAIIQMIIMLLITIGLFIIGGKINAKMIKDIAKSGEAAATGTKAAAAGAKAAAAGTKVTTAGTKAAAETAKEAGQITQNTLTQYLSRLTENILTALKIASLDSSKMFKTIMNLLTKIVESLGKALSTASEATGKALTATANQLNIIKQQLLALIKRASESILNSIKKPMTWVQALDTSKNLLSIGVNIYSGAVALEKAHYQKQIARLHEEIAKLEAQISIMQSLSNLSLDQSATLKNITKDSEALAEAWVKLVNMVASFTQEASKNLNVLVTAGAAH